MPSNQPPYDRAEAEEVVEIVDGGAARPAVRAAGPARPAAKPLEVRPAEGRSASAGSKVSRQPAAFFFRKMFRDKIYPLTVRIGTDEEGGRAAGATVTVQPLIPGAQVTPAVVEISAAAGAEAQFQVVPVIKGRLKEARVEFRSRGKLLGTTPLPMKAKADRGFLFRFFVLLVVLLPALIVYAKSYAREITNFKFTYMAQPKTPDNAEPPGSTRPSPTRPGPPSRPTRPGGPLPRPMDMSGLERQPAGEDGMQELASVNVDVKQPVEPGQPPPLPGEEPPGGPPARTAAQLKPFDVSGAQAIEAWLGVKAGVLVSVDPSESRPERESVDWVFYGIYQMETKAPIVKTGYEWLLVVIEWPLADFYAFLIFLGLAITFWIVGGPVRGQVRGATIDIPAGG